MAGTAADDGETSTVARPRVPGDLAGIGGAIERNAPMRSCFTPFAFHAATLCVAALTGAAMPAANAEDATYDSGTHTVNRIYSVVDTNNNATTNFISGAKVFFASGYHIATLNVGGGVVDEAHTHDISTLNISSGGVSHVSGTDQSTLNISGGDTTYARGYDTSTTNISGGTVTNGFMLNDTGAKANFVGMGLTSTYMGYNNTNPYGTYADFFKVSGTIGGTMKTYTLYIKNDDGEGGAVMPNGAPRQFTFNGTVPPCRDPTKDAERRRKEVGVLTLVLIALVVVCSTVIVRRRRAV